MIIKEGSRWSGADGKIFIVISKTTLDGNHWVYYRDELKEGSPHEYSCYEESFLVRFRPIPDDHYNKNRKKNYGLA
jgi:hypothetical protein